MNGRTLESTEEEVADETGVDSYLDLVTQSNSMSVQRGALQCLPEAWRLPPPPLPLPCALPSS